jgi:putative ABC transport system permease protein
MRMMGMEGLVVALVGLVLGTVVAAGAIVPFSLVASHSLLPTGPLWIYLSVIGVIGVLALSASLVPAWLTTRARPADAAMSGE